MTADEVYEQLLREGLSPEEAAELVEEATRTGCPEAALAIFVDMLEGGP